MLNSIKSKLPIIALPLLFGTTSCDQQGTSSEYSDGPGGIPMANIIPETCNTVGNALLDISREELCYHMATPEFANKVASDLPTAMDYCEIPARYVGTPENAWLDCVNEAYTGVAVPFIRIDSTFNTENRTSKVDFTAETIGGTLTQWSEVNPRFK